jgi:hypothetical protein
MACALLGVEDHFDAVHESESAGPKESQPEA